VAKAYLAIVLGKIIEDEGTVEVPIERDRKQRKRMKATKPGRGKTAKSTFQVLERFVNATLVKVRIETGRTHQIRVHMAFTGHPLLGDVTYGGPKAFGEAVHFLHSHRLSFSHPISRKKLVFVSEVPEKFRRVLEKLKCGLPQESR